MKDDLSKEREFRSQHELLNDESRDFDRSQKVFFQVFMIDLMVFENIAWQLGGKGDYANDWNHTLNFENVIVLSKSFEDRFDNSESILVPMDTDQGTPQQLRMIVLESPLLPEPIPTWEYLPGLWGARIRLQKIRSIRTQVPLSYSAQ